MGKGKTTSSNKVTPWIPNDATFAKFQNRASGTITPEFQRALAGARTDNNAAARSFAGAQGAFSDGRATIGGAGQFAGAHGGAMGVLSDAMDPSARSAAFDQVKANTLADILPAINDTFSGNGMTGSSLHAQNLGKGVAAGMADVENQAFQQGQDRAISAAGMASGINDSAFAKNVQLGQAKLGAGQAQLGLGNAKLGLGAARLNVGTTDQDARSGALSNLLSTAVGASGNAQTQSKKAGLAGVIGGGLQLASLFSDRRVKTDIKRVGAMDDGTPIYTYRYQFGFGAEFGGKALMGVMAQDLEERGKGYAVAEVDGIKMVSYGEL